jgi:hypothetical protein
MESIKRRRLHIPPAGVSIAAMLGAAGIGGPGLFSDKGRNKGPIELDMEIAAEKRRALRSLRGVTKSLPLSAHYRRRVDVEPAQDSKRARKAAGVRGRKSLEAVLRAVQARRQGASVNHWLESLCVIGGVAIMLSVGAAFHSFPVHGASLWLNVVIWVGYTLLGTAGIMLIRAGRSSPEPSVAENGIEVHIDIEASGGASGDELAYRIVDALSRLKTDPR